MTQETFEPRNEWEQKLLIASGITPTELLGCWGVADELTYRAGCELLHTVSIHQLGEVDSVHMVKSRDTPDVAILFLYLAEPRHTP